MPKINSTYSFFTEKLLLWNTQENDRNYPWRSIKDPYKIWLSEILLQQTRSDQGLAYYLKFIKQYPDIHQLAAAADDDVFLLWQGLGYYNRCKNLLITARYIAHDLKGIFPDNFDDLLKLKGVGNYTASAIASFAYNLPNAVLDGNVFRVLSRFFGLFLPIDSIEGKKHFEQLAQKHLAKQEAASYNQAIMDFGATVCKPKLPKCSVCPLAENCKALQHNYIDQLPVKAKKIKVSYRYFHFLILQIEDEFFIQQRIQKDIWQQLYQFYLIELEGDFKKSIEWKAIMPFVDKVEHQNFKYKQRLTHQLIQSDFHIVQMNKKPDFLENGQWIKKTDWRNYSFPKTILSFFEKNVLFLESN